MTKTLPISKAREELATLVNDAQNKLSEFVITVNGIPAAAIISAVEYESWRETNEILNDKDLMKTIKKGEKEIKEGKAKDWEVVKKKLKLDVRH